MPRKNMNSKFAIMLAASLVLAGNFVQNLYAESGPPKGATLLMERQRQAGPTKVQDAWLKATPDERIRLAEGLGEKGARNWARSQGWKPLLDNSSKSVPQGPDMVYRAKDGIVHVIEAKGGGAQLGHGYGHPQGSAEWAVKSAERILNGNTATELEKSAAKAVVEAAAKGQLRVHVVRTTHVLGEPTGVVLEQTRTCTESAAKLAQLAMKRAVAEVKVPAPVTVEGHPPSIKAPRSSGNALRTVAKGATVVGLVVDGGLRTAEAVEVERQYEAGEITSQERVESHARNAAGMAGGWGGAAAAGKFGAEGGAAIGTFFCPGLGTAIGGVLGGLGGGVVGYIGGEWLGESVTDWWFSW